MVMAGWGWSARWAAHLPAKAAAAWLPGGWDEGQKGSPCAKRLGAAWL